MNAKYLAQLFLAIVLAGSAAAYAVEGPIVVGTDGGKSVAVFKIGDSRCVLVDDKIVCMRLVTK
jgi:serine/threonine protein phosphatase PrpC